MAEGSTLLQTRRSHLLADAQLSLSALLRSLADTNPAAGEASLHATDLSGLFSVLGLRAEAQHLRELSRALAEDAHGATDQARAAVVHLHALVQALQTDDADAQAAASQALAAIWPAAPVAAPSSSVPSPASETYGSTMAYALPSPANSASTSNPVVATTPLFSSGLVSAPYAPHATATANTAAPVASAPPATRSELDSLLRQAAQWDQVRAQALETVQDAAIGMQSNQHPQLRPALHKLQAAQDALLQVGQLPLTRVYPDVVGADGVKLDAPVLDLLEHLQVFSQRAFRTVAQVRNLTLYVLWEGASLSQTEWEHVGLRVAQAHGRLERAPGGIQLVLPVSWQRMRMQTFQQADQWRAISSAQFLGWGAGAGTQMRLCVGTHNSTRSVTQAGEAQSLNIYPWPPSVAAPADVTGVGMDGQGRLYLLELAQP